MKHTLTVARIILKSFWGAVCLPFLNQFRRLSSLRSGSLRSALAALLLAPLAPLNAAGASTVASADYYVAANGNDSNPGTVLLPFATIERARLAVRAQIASGMTKDITVMLRGGTYYISNTLAFTAADSGVNGHRVVYRNYPEEVPVIDGGVPITGWTETSPGSGVYQANAANLNFRQLYVNNRRGIRARWPNADAVNPFFVTTNGLYKYRAPANPPAAPPDPATTSHYRMPKANMAAWENLNNVEIVTTDAFMAVRGLLSSYTTDDEYAYVYVISPERFMPKDQDQGSYFFENAYEFIDAPGEWYLNTSTGIVYYKPLPGEDMSAALVVAPRLEQMVSITDANNITFYGLTFQHSTWLLPSSEGLFHRQSGMRNAGGLPTNPGAIYLRSTGNIVFERNLIKHMGANGMTLDRGVHDTMINGNVFYEIADTAINHAVNWNVYVVSNIGGVQIKNLGPQNTDPIFQVRNDTIKNNYIYKTGVDYYSGGGIWSYYSIGLKILHNEIEDVPNIGINVGWGATQGAVPAYKDVEIQYNKIHNTCKWSNDSGGIHTKSNPENGHIFENWIFNIQKRPDYLTGSNWPVCGVYLDDGSDYFRLENNVVEDVGGHEWYSGDTSGVGGLRIKVRNVNIGSHNTFINNAAQKVGPHPVTGAITVMQWPEFPAWGSPIDADTAQRVKANAGIEPAYIDIKDWIKDTGLQVGEISASPARQTVAPGQPGSTTISWTTDQADEAEVTVSANGSPEAAFATGTSSNATLAPWINAGRYVFRLYGDLTRTRLLDTVEVMGTHSPLTVQTDGSVRLDNRLYQGFGVNYFDAFNRVLWSPADTTYEAGFQNLAKWGLPFARMDVSGFWPRDASLFFTDRAEYFRRLDAVIASAEQHGIGLIPSFFWTTFTFSDLAGEHLDQLAVTNSGTRQRMREFTTAIVNRYKTSRAVWAWEFGNEWNLMVDLPNGDQFLPPTWTDLGNPATRDPVRDQISTGIILPAMQEFADLARSLDPGRPISSGHATPRTAAWHMDQWRRGLLSLDQAWTPDSSAQAKEIALRQCPAPFDLLSIHPYSISEDVPRVANYAQIAAESGKALFVGEFGAFTESDYNQLLAASRVAPLIAMWCYDRIGAEASDGMNATTANSRHWMLEALVPTTYQAWARGWERLDKPGGIGPTAFGQYAFGAPSPGAPFPSLKLDLVGSTFSAESIVRINDPTLTVLGETSPSLAADSWTSTGVSVVASPDQTHVLPGFERRIFSVPRTATDAKKFLRLRAISP